MDDQVAKDALVTDCGQYRYWLTRTWSSDRRLPFVMLNPSTADASVDDPTIGRCIGFAKREGYGGLLVLNLFALRSADPAALTTRADPVGPQNDAMLSEMFSRAASDDIPVVAAWGNNGLFADRSSAVVELARAAGARLMCLGKTAADQPKHPLYVRSDQPLLAF